MPAVIPVTQDHIDSSIREDSSHCMLAEAIKDALPGVKRVSVDLATIRYTHKRKRYVYLTPRPAQVALLEFDNGRPITPFKLRLGKAAQILEPSKREGTTKVTANKEGAQRHGGQAPPMGPLAGGAVPTPMQRDKLRTGRIRKYGLKSLGR